MRLGNKHNIFKTPNNIACRCWSSHLLLHSPRYPWQPHSLSSSFSPSLDLFLATDSSEADLLLPHLGKATFQGGGLPTGCLWFSHLVPQVPVSAPDGFKHPPPCPNPPWPDHRPPAGHHPQAWDHPQALRLCQHWLRPPRYRQSLRFQIQVEQQQEAHL